MSEKVAIIFGGSGSVGMAFVEHLLTAPSSDTAYSVIILADLRPPTPCHYQTHLKAGLSTGKVTYVSVDVRDIQTFKTLPARCDLIANFAAVHREPGHASHEYFETNLKGAESVTAYATQAHCTKLLFTSSISPYGPADQAKTEASLPCPNTPYGISKLIAEKIHLIWASAKSERLLIIVRPGVLFGPGEGGNVGRMALGEGQQCIEYPRLIAPHQGVG
ncbi:MAG: NAD(P)-dependent oxidoreductase [Gammaproteobacteria bacterium]